MKLFMLILLALCAYSGLLAQSNIRQIEYGWDTDLGHGLNTIIAVNQTSGDYNLNLSMQGLTRGYHLLFLRSRDANRLWSHTQTNLVNAQPGANPARIVRLDYTYSQGATQVGQYSYTLPTPSASVDMPIPGNTAQLVNGQTYMLSIWAIDENGTRSQVYMKSFVRTSSACETARTGNWNDTGTWVCGRVPLVSDEVVINAGHIITVNSGLFRAQSITYRGGKLQFSSGGRLALAVP